MEHAEPTAQKGKTAMLIFTAILKISATAIPRLT